MMDGHIIQNRNDWSKWTYRKFPKLSITLKNSDDVVGTDIKNFYYTTAATEPDKTSIGTDSKTQWVKISEEEFKALDDENNDIKATFKRAEVKSNGLYDNAEYTLTITAQVSQANKEACCNLDH